MAEEKKKPKRHYQVWKGSNKFFCGGRLIFGPDVASLFFSILLVAGPAVSFCIKVYNIINHNKEHDKYIGYWYGVLIVAVALTCLDITFLFMTSSRDPGIVPRNASPPDPDETYEMNTPSMEWINGRTPRLKLPRTKDVIVNGHSVKVKYCDTCMLYRPPRASHCSVCNNCVQRFDHHCPWLGQCIGLRNYRFFYMFISTSTILCIYVFAFTWINIAQQEDRVLKTMSTDILSDFLLVYCFIAGVKKNLAEIFLSKIPPSLNDFRAYIQEDDSIVMEPTSPNLGSTSKEKIDIEMGNKFVEASGLSLPQILQNLHHKHLEDNMRSKEGNGASDSLPSPFCLETKEDSANAEDKCDEDSVTPEIQPVHQ
ncbi:Zinc finger, DHHC-type, palmitoyltransferase, partial [Cynara cardunculus var. scolymus]